MLIWLHPVRLSRRLPVQILPLVSLVSLCNVVLDFPMSRPVVGDDSVAMAAHLGLVPDLAAVDNAIGLAFQFPERIRFPLLGRSWS